MALIKCPDCGKMFSEYAEQCPECGCPVETAKKKIDQEKEKHEENPDLSVYLPQNVVEK